MATLLLYGPAGVGKTTLAVALARRQGGHGLEAADEETARFLREQAAVLDQGRPIRSTLQSRLLALGFREDAGARSVPIVVPDYPGSDIEAGASSEVRRTMGLASAVLVLLPAADSRLRAADLYRPGADRWARMQELVALFERLVVAGGGRVRVPVAVVLSMADRAGLTGQTATEEAAIDALEQAHGPIVELIRRYAPRLRFFAASAFGPTEADDPQTPPRAGEERPFGIEAPIAWAVREAEAAALEHAREVDPRNGRPNPAADRFLEAFPRSPDAAEVRALRTRRRRSPARWLVALAAVLAIALAAGGASRLADRLRPPEPVADGGPEPEPLPSDPLEIYRRRLREMTAQPPRTVDEADRAVERLAFLEMLVEIEPGRQRAAVFLAEVDGFRRRLAGERERLAADELAGARRDWRSVVLAIEKFLEQERKGEAYTKADEFRSAHWKTWAGWTWGNEPNHERTAERLREFVALLAGLPQAASLLAPLATEAARFLEDQWRWETFRQGGWFHEVQIEKVWISELCEVMRHGDGAAQLSIQVGEKVVYQRKDFAAREPDDSGWYEYWFGDHGPIESIEIPVRDETVFTLIELDRWPNPDNEARQWFKGPLDLFGPLGQEGKEVAFKCPEETYDHVRVEFRFLEYRHYVLEPDPR